ncbi:unnamed protein product [Periconia digitata]|uniref:Peptidase metallopeptidase domain-containing protein n=1 Tax=Periconia digitata TaxID=1303443 RepID=A0A9W4U6Q2_9PLEO|nr:unnamed protein product [Periconia digitata]
MKGLVAWLLLIITYVVAQQPGSYEATRTALIPSSPPQPTPTSGFRIDPKKLSKEVHGFFRAYGWLKHNQTIQDSEMPRAIRKIQRAIRHPETGVYDAGLNAVMSRPRCGTEQPYNATAANDGSDLHKRYVLWGPKWNHSPVTYRFINYTADLDVASQRTVISQAFAKWSTLTALQIVPAASNAAGADINIMFRAMGSSETAYAITNMRADGVELSSGLISITFNDDFPWNDDRLFNFTAVHEIGHALGLSHSTVEDAVMFAYYFEGLLRPLHPDDKAAIHKVYGWNTPRFTRIDSNSALKSVIQVSSSTDTTTNINGIYQLRTNGQILYYTPGRSWTTLSTATTNTAQITGANGILYQRRSDGSIYRFTSSSSTWQLIGAPSDSVLDIVAASTEIYARRRDGVIARWGGTQQSWTTIPGPTSPLPSQIAVTDSKTLWILLSNGDLVRSLWPYTSEGWQLVDINPDNIQIAVGGDEFYKLQRDGAVVWLDMKNYFWSIIEDNGSVEVFAVGGFAYSRHDDGSLWRYTGVPMVWELLDEEREAVGVVGDREGNVYQVVQGGEIWRLVS